MLSWFFTSQDFAVSALVFVSVLILLSGMGSYALYRGLLRPCVEYGEWHPANLRRLGWWIFLILSAISIRLMLDSWLRPAATWALIIIILAFGLILWFTHKRV